MNRLPLIRTIVLSACLITTGLHAADWPQWMGPQRNGEWRESGVITEVPEQGLPVTWRVPLGLGYAGPAVAGGRVFVLDYQLSSGEVAANPGAVDKLQGQERIVCLDARSGEQLWAHSDDQPYAISYGSGPRTTPTIDGDRVYALGAEGKLSCVKAASGDVVWTHDLKEEYGAATPYWGHTAHPLVQGELLISLVGGEGSAVVAFDKRTGKEVWRSLNAKDIGYCPPTMAVGVLTPQLLIWLPDGVYGLKPQTGEQLWFVPLVPDFGMSIAAPAFSKKTAFFSGVQNVSMLIELSDDAAAPQELWRGTGSTSVGCAHAGPIIIDDTIFACDDKGWVRAVDRLTGKRLWESLAATGLERPANYGTAF
ncbi:MAG: PQQ-binding-like beta-propeller repeat protein, partial [Pirellulales bacterium]